MSGAVKNSRTYKRELSLLIFLWNVYLSIFNLQAFEVSIGPSFIFMGLAFGLDWWGKTGPRVNATNMVATTTVELPEDRP